MSTADRRGGLVPCVTRRTTDSVHIHRFQRACVFLLVLTASICDLSTLGAAVTPSPSISIETTPSISLPRITHPPVVAVAYPSVLQSTVVSQPSPPAQRTVYVRLFYNVTEGFTHSTQITAGTSLPTATSTSTTTTSPFTDAPAATRFSHESLKDAELVPAKLLRTPTDDAAGGTNTTTSNNNSTEPTGDNNSTEPAEWAEYGYNSLPDSLKFSPEVTLEPLRTGPYSFSALASSLFPSGTASSDFSDQGIVVVNSTTLKFTLRFDPRYYSNADDHIIVQVGLRRHSGTHQGEPFPYSPSLDPPSVRWGFLTIGSDPVTEQSASRLRVFIYIAIAINVLLGLIVPAAENILFVVILYLLPLCDCSRSLEQRLVFGVHDVLLFYRVVVGADSTDTRRQEWGQFVFSPRDALRGTMATVLVIIIFHAVVLTVVSHVLGSNYSKQVEGRLLDKTVKRNMSLRDKRQALQDVKKEKTKALRTYEEGIAAALRFPSLSVWVLQLFLPVLSFCSSRVLQASTNPVYLTAGFLGLALALVIPIVLSWSGKAKETSLVGSYKTNSPVTMEVSPYHEEPTRMDKVRYWFRKLVYPHGTWQPQSTFLRYASVVGGCKGTRQVWAGLPHGVGVVIAACMAAQVKTPTGCVVQRTVLGTAHVLVGFVFYVMWPLRTHLSNICLVATNVLVAVAFYAVEAEVAWLLRLAVVLVPLLSIIASTTTVVVALYFDGLSLKISSSLGANAEGLKPTLTFPTWGSAASPRNAKGKLGISYDDPEELPAGGRGQPARHFEKLLASQRGPVPDEQRPGMSSRRGARMSHDLRGGDLDVPLLEVNEGSNSADETVEGYQASPNPQRPSVLPSIENAAVTLMANSGFRNLEGAFSMPVDASPKDVPARPRSSAATTVMDRSSFSAPGQAAGGSPSHQVPARKVSFRMPRHHELTVEQGMLLRDDGNVNSIVSIEAAEDLDPGWDDGYSVPLWTRPVGK